MDIVLRKIDVKCAYLRFLMYKVYFVVKKLVWNVRIKAFWYAIYIFDWNLFIYQKSLKRTYKTIFFNKITFWVCVLVLWIHKCYYVVKKLVWMFILNIKAFWYTIIKDYDSKTLLKNKILKKMFLIILFCKILKLNQL